MIRRIFVEKKADFAIKAKELKEEMETLKERYYKARNEGIKRGSYAALLSGNKAMMAYRKLSVKAGRDDPFAKLRPMLSQAEAGILYNIDNRYYKGDHLVIRGWSYEQAKGLVDLFPKKGFIFVSQEYKGQPLGKAAIRLRYMADMKIRVAGYKAYCQGRATGEPGAYYRVWEEGIIKTSNNY